MEIYYEWSHKSVFESMLGELILLVYMVKLATLGPGWPLIVLSDTCSGGSQSIACAWLMRSGKCLIHTCACRWKTQCNAVADIHHLACMRTKFHTCIVNPPNCSTKHAFIHAHAVTHHTTPAILHVFWVACHALWLLLHCLLYELCCTIRSLDCVLLFSRPTAKIIWWHHWWPLRCSFDVSMNSDLRNPLSLLHPPRFELEVLRK